MSIVESTGKQAFQTCMTFFTRPTRKLTLRCSEKAVAQTRKA